MIGNSLLNQIVNEQGFTQPNEILFHLREEVIKALKQTGAMGESRDGMDIALLSIENNKLEFAGANNPLLQYLATMICYYNKWHYHNFPLKSK